MTQTSASSETQWSQETYLETYQFAALAHVGQCVPGTEVSYIQHLSFVSMEILAALPHQAGVIKEDLALRCALLHDVIEDTAVTFEEVVLRFGPLVGAGVQALTKDKTLEKAAQMEDSLHRIKQQTHEVWMVKLADRISNLLPPPAHWDTSKRCYYRDEAQIIHDSLSPASPYLAARLQKKIDNYAKYY